MYESSTTGQRIYSFPLIFLITIAFVAIRIVYLKYGSFSQSGGLFFDEAQYWTWSKDLDFGYYSKPPLIAGLIYLTTNLSGCGDGVFCIRISAPILHGLTGIIIYFIAEFLFDKKTAFWSSLAYLTLPGVTLSSVFISTDAPLMFFWALSLLCFIRAVNEDFGNKWWLLCGIAAGFGMMSKYTMIMFLPSAVLYLLITRESREYLWSFSFLVSLGVAFALFSPNLFWNFNHNFVSISHTQENVFSREISIYPTKTFEFIAGQYGVFGPVLFTVLFVVIWKILKLIKEDEKKILICFAFPVLFTAIGISLVSSAQAHWAAPSYITATILVTRFLIESKWQSFIKLSLIINVVAAAVFYHHEFIINKIGIDFRPLERIHKWNEMSKKLPFVLNKFPDSYIVSDERKAVASIMYNLRLQNGQPYPVLKWNPDKTVKDYYDMNTDVNLLKGSNFIYLTKKPNIEYDSLYFDNTARIGEIYESDKEKYYVYYMKSFKGY